MMVLLGSINPLLFITSYFLASAFFSTFFSSFLASAFAGAGAVVAAGAAAGAGALAGSAAKEVKANADKIVAINVFISFP
jgi:hypothetical protein